jgi:hypothetical protein
MKGVPKVQNLEELGLSALPGWDETISEWIFVGLTDFACLTCEIFFMIIAPNPKSAFPSDYLFICSSCLGKKRFVDFPMAQQGLMLDKFNLIEDDGIEKYSRESLKTLNGINIVFGTNKNTALGETPESNTQEKSFGILPRELRGNEDAPIPKGFRSIAWIRFYEAEAIIHAYKTQSDFELKSESQSVVLKCNFFADDSEEKRKFKANVQAIRVNNQNQRVIGWIRPEEARAVVEANTSLKDVDFAHLKFGNGGKVQYFSPELEVAKKYRSTTRLLRKD